MKSAQPTAEDDAFVGARLAGRYRIERVLGRGGMGVVYEAVQEDLGRRVAIKLISGTVSVGGLARLRLEAEATARLGNPHIVQVTDFQSNPGEPPFIVMELLHGRSLHALLRNEGVIGWQRAARFGCQILEALAAAHEAQIVHRDIKPDNVFVLASAAVPDMIKVLDFGVAKLIAEDARGMTAAGALIGTLAYMSPEVLRGSTIDARSDLYAVAVTLYESVAGRRPIEGTSQASLFAAITMSEPTPLARWSPHVPEAFAAVLMRSLRKSPDERFQRAGEMALALAACLGPSADEPAHTAMGGYRDAGAPSTQVTHATSTTHGTNTPNGAPTTQGEPSRGVPSTWNATGAPSPPTLASDQALVLPPPPSPAGGRPSPWQPITSSAPLESRGYARSPAAPGEAPPPYWTPPHAPFPVQGPGALAPPRALNASPVSPSASPGRGAGIVIAVLVVLLVAALGVAGALMVRFSQPGLTAAGSPGAGPIASLTPSLIAARLTKAGWSVGIQATPDAAPSYSMTVTIAKKDGKNVQVNVYDFVDERTAAAFEARKEFVSPAMPSIVKRERARLLAVYCEDAKAVSAALDAIVK